MNILPLCTLLVNICSKLVFVNAKKKKHCGRRKIIANVAASPSFPMIDDFRNLQSNLCFFQDTFWKRNLLDNKSSDHFCLSLIDRLN